MLLQNKNAVIYGGGGAGHAKLLLRQEGEKR